MSQEELRNLTAECGQQVEAALTAALLRPCALARAAELEAGSLVELREAAEPYLAAVAAAREELRKEKTAVSAQVAKFWSSRSRGDPDDREPEPERQTPRLQELEAALSAAEQEATPFESRVWALEEEIATLRAVPEPAADVLWALGMALVGGSLDAD